MAGSYTEACSRPLRTIRRRRSGPSPGRDRDDAAVEPETGEGCSSENSTMLLASVPPEVKTICCGPQSRTPASLLRLSSSSFSARCPSPWTAEGLAKKLAAVTLMLWRISGSGGALAAQSRYTSPIGFLKNIVNTRSPIKAAAIASPDAAASPGA